MELAFTGKFIRDGKDVYLLDSIIHIPSDNLDLESVYIQILVELIDDINKDILSVDESVALVKGDGDGIHEYNAD